VTLLTPEHFGVPAGSPGRDLVVDGVEHVYHSAKGDVQALTRLDARVRQGEFVSIVGPSGCGKSTLLELIAGLRAPSSGVITLDERVIIGPSRHRGMVFQSSSSLYPWLTVRGNVELGLAMQGVGRRARRARAAEEIARVALTDFADHHVYELSGGMQQRCQIARALAVDPEVLLLDEPFGALDALTRESLQTSLREIWRSTNRTFVFVTHSIEEAVLLSSRVLVMSPRPGRILVDRELPFSRSGREAADLRADPHFVAACHDLRVAITEPRQEGTPR
jgi:ABC-type nitrate/sulfonate/bicarbonate transport system ATPase subunit